MGNLTNNATTSLAEDDTVILELMTLVPDVEANHNGLQFHVISQFFYVDLVTRDDLQLSNAFEQLTLVEPVMEVYVRIPARYLRKKHRNGNVAGGRMEDNLGKRDGLASRRADGKQTIWLTD